MAIYDTAARVGAIKQAKSVDCDIQEGYLVLRAETQKNDCDQLFWLSEQTVELIRTFYVHGREFLFPWPYHSRTLYSVFRRNIVEPAGLRSAKTGMNLFHKIRRTSLSYLARTDIRIAMQQAGHSREEITRKHYIDQRIARSERRASDVLPKLDVDLKPRLGLLRLETEEGDE